MKKTIVLGALVAAQLVAALMIQVIIIRDVGVNKETDAFIASQSVASVFFAIIQVGLQSVWFPRFSAYSNETVAWRNLLENALGQAMALSCFVFLVMMVTSGLWLSKLYPTFDKQQITETQKCLCVFSVANVLSVASLLLALALRSIEKSLLVEILNAIVMVGSLGLVHWVAEQGALFPIAIIVLLRTVVLVFFLFKITGWPMIQLKNGYQEDRAWRQMWPVLWAASLYKLSPLVDRYWAGQAPAGALTVFNLAQTGIGAISMLLERSICVPLSASFGSYARQRRFNTLRATYRKGVAKVIFVASGFMLFSMSAKPQFLDIAEVALSIPYEVANELWWMCVLLVGYLLGAASATLPVAVLNALHDTKVPVSIGVAGFFFSLPIKALGFIYWGLEGMVLGASLHHIFNLIALVVACEAKIHRTNIKSIY